MGFKKPSWSSLISCTAEESGRGEMKKYKTEEIFDQWRHIFVLANKQDKKPVRKEIVLKQDIYFMEWLKNFDKPVILSPKKERNSKSMSEEISPKNSKRNVKKQHRHEDIEICNNSQFFFKFDNFHFSGFGSFFSSLKLTLNLPQPLLNFFVLLVSIFCLVSGSFKFFLQFSHSFLVLDSSVFQNLPHAVAVISSGCSLVKLSGCNEELVFTSFKISFKALDSSVQSIDLKLSGEKRVLLLLELLSGGEELLGGFVQLNLQLLRLLDKLSNLLFSFCCSNFSILSSLLTHIGPVHCIVLLHLHCPHLLLDSIHVDGLLALLPWQ